MITDNCNISIMKLLHAIFIPKPKVVEKQYVKYTIADSQEAFCTEFLNSSNVTYDSNDLERGPYIVICGEGFKYDTFFVVLNDLKLEFSSFLEAMEYCFKLFKVFNCNFSKQCELVWMFVSKYLFEIETPMQSPIVNTFINDITNIK